MNSVCILDYGSGNVKSVFNLFSSITGKTVISNDPAEIERATHIVLPGVGSFGAAMRHILEKLPMEALKENVLAGKKPFLGICVGMQVLADLGREFGEHAGLGWIAGTVDKLETKELPLPHIGWNNINPKQESPLLQGLGETPDYYFVHSFAFRPKDPAVVLATTEYGGEFCSAIRKDNIFGVQFHPEKSQRTGLKLVKNFLSLT